MHLLDLFGMELLTIHFILYNATTIVLCLGMSDYLAHCLVKQVRI